MAPFRSGSRRRYRGDTPRPPGRRSPRQRFVSALTAVFLLAGLAGARAEGPDPAQEPGGLGLSLDGLLGKALGATELLAPSGLGRLRVPGEVRVLLVSSGADKATFGDGYAKQLTRSGDVDEVGLGTYAASVLFPVTLICTVEFQPLVWNRWNGTKVPSPIVRSGYVRPVDCGAPPSS